MGTRRSGRDDNPLAGLLQRSPRREEDHGREELDRGHDRPASPDTDVAEEQRATRPVARTAPRTGARRGGPADTGPERKRRGRPRGGRRSNPDYVQISARIHKEVRFSLERVLAERSEREGRYVEMAEVLEDLMRFYVEYGDPNEVLGER